MSLLDQTDITYLGVFIGNYQKFLRLKVLISSRHLTNRAIIKLINELRSFLF